MARRPRRDPGLPEAHGVLRIDKPYGPTSGEIVDWVRWALRGTPVGHFGTLDPAATGLLIVAVGGATRLNPYLMEQDKRYRARIVLGRSTSTADAQGETLQTRSVDGAVLERGPEVIRGLVGSLSLPPPAYSAIRVDGVRSYDRARKGEAVELPCRPMVVHAVSSVGVDPPDALEAEVLVSKGTYVRSLAEEVGRRLGCPAHLGGLRRLASGRLELSPPHIAGFDVEPIAPGRDGKPRHRIRWRDAAPERDAQAEAIRKVLVSPALAVPFEVHAARPDAEGARVLKQLGHGQTIAPDDPGLATPVVSDRVGIVPPTGPGLVVAERVDHGLRAVRTIVPWSPRSS